MKTTILLKNIVAALAAMLVLSGCKGGGPSSQIFVRSGEGRRTLIAVLPFDNISREQDAGRIVTSTVMTYLLSTGAFDVVEPGVVYAAIASENVRLTEGVTAEACAKLQAKLGADAFIVGLVEEYGEVRIGADSYPSISFSARLIDARAATILWAATISKTGADSVKVFDIGRVSSMGKLCKQAVAAMAQSLAKAKSRLAMVAAAPTTADASTTGTAQKPGAEGASAPGTTVVTPLDTGPVPAQASRSLDESATYGENDLTALLQDVGTAKVGKVTHKKHYHDQVETQYTLSGGKAVEVRLVDYRKKDIAAKFVEHDHPGEKAATFEGMTAFTSTSSFGYYHLDIAVGRFGLFIRGPKNSKNDADALATGLVAMLR